MDLWVQENGLYVPDIKTYPLNLATSTRRVLKRAHRQAMQPTSCLMCIHITLIWKLLNCKTLAHLSFTTKVLKIQIFTSQTGFVRPSGIQVVTHLHSNEARCVFLKILNANDTSCVLACQPLLMFSTRTAVWWHAHGKTLDTCWTCRSVRHCSPGNTVTFGLGHPVTQRNSKEFMCVSVFSWTILLGTQLLQNVPQMLAKPDKLLLGTSS